VDRCNLGLYSGLKRGYLIGKGIGATHHRVCRDEHAPPQPTVKAFRRNVVYDVHAMERQKEPEVHSEHAPEHDELHCRQPRKVNVDYRYVVTREKPTQANQLRPGKNSPPGEIREDPF
jgi:hypothetical protein